MSTHKLKKNHAEQTGRIICAVNSINLEFTLGYFVLRTLQREGEKRPGYAELEVTPALDGNSFGTSPFALHHDGSQTPQGRPINRDYLPGLNIGVANPTSISSDLVRIIIWLNGNEYSRIRSNEFSDRESYDDALAELLR